MENISNDDNFYIQIKVKEKINLNKKNKTILKQNRFKVNKVFKDDLSSKLEFKEDEIIEGYFSKIDHLYKFIKMLLENIEDCFNIIIIKTNLDDFTEKTIDKLYKKLKKDKFFFHIKTDDKTFDNLLNNNINMVFLIKKTYTPKKIKIIAEYEKLNDQQLVADKLGMSQQQVSYHLNTAYWKQLKTIEERINAALESYRYRIIYY